MSPAAAEPDFTAELLISVAPSPWHPRRPCSAVSPSPTVWRQPTTPLYVCGCHFVIFCVFFYCYFNAYEGKMDSSIFEFLYSPFLELTMTEWMFNFIAY
jgi:hypothetical protein